MSFTDTLKKMLKRTERDVALAGAMCGSVAAMSKLFPAMEGYSTLRVNFYGDRHLEWTQAPVVAHSGAWRDFLRWYHGRPQSEAYVMLNRAGCDMFRRCDVRGYVIRYGEREKAT